MEPISFQGTITVVDSIAKSEQALDVLFKQKVIGFDTESRPAFFKGQKFPVSIIQLATRMIFAGLMSFTGLSSHHFMIYQLR